MAIQGHHYEDIDDNLKERFLDLVAQGYTRPEAASALGASARQLRACCNPESRRYDAKFAKQYAKLTEKDGEHQHALAERLQSAAIERGLRSSDRLLEKLLIITHPDWKVHQPQAMQINFRVDEMKNVFAELSDETLEKMIAELQAKELRQIEAAEIIDVEPE
jgi:hypothetical protein